MSDDFSEEAITESLQRIADRKKRGDPADPFEVLVMELAELGLHRPIGTLSMFALNRMLERVLEVARRDWGRDLAKPYPADVFAPLTDNEVKRLVEAMTATGITAPSERLHARWARMLADGAE